MIIRLRSRDGLERIEAKDEWSLGDLKQRISFQLEIPLEQVHLSKNQNLLLSKTPKMFTDMSDELAPLSSCGLQNGDMIFLYYLEERDVQPVYKPGPFETKKFGQKMTVEDMVAQQVRIERQENAKIASVSFDRHAANAFQTYVRSALAFSIKRGGYLYGDIDDEDNIKVAFIYEPPQEGSAEQLILERGTSEEQKVDFIANILGYKRVGIILSQSTKERDFIASTSELKMMAAMQDELGEKSAMALVSLDENEEGGHVHFEAYQCSEQCVKLHKEGWFVPDQEEHGGMVKMQNPNEPDKKDPVIVAGKDVDEVDNDFFLCPVNILDHQGALSCTFPVENRLLPQGKSELRKHLQGNTGKDYVEKLADFHVMLFLAKHLDNSDMALLAEAVRDRKPILEGYRVIIDSIAGIH